MIGVNEPKQSSFYRDVRKPEGWVDGIVEGAVQISLTDLATQAGLAQLPRDKSTIIAVYCKSGQRSALASPLLHQLGFDNVASMKGGYEAWGKAGFNVTGAAAQ